MVNLVIECGDETVEIDVTDEAFELMEAHPEGPPGFITEAIMHTIWSQQNNG